MYPLGEGRCSPPPPSPPRSTATRLESAPAGRRRALFRRERVPVRARTIVYCRDAVAGTNTEDRAARATTPFYSFCLKRTHKKRTYQSDFEVPA